MNQKNVDYIFEQVKGIGFGESLNPAITAKFKNDPAVSSVPYRHEYPLGLATGELNFSKSKTSDYQFLNTMTMKAMPLGKPEASMTFYIENVDRTLNYSRREAFNLLSGRAVYKNSRHPKTKKIEKVWRVLDLNDKDEKGKIKSNYYNESYGFNLEKELGKLNIVDWDKPETKKEIMDSMKRGNIHNTAIKQNGDVVIKGLEAVPEFHEIKQHKVANAKSVGVENSTDAQGTGESTQSKTQKTGVKADEESPSESVKRGAKAGTKGDDQSSLGHGEKQPKATRKKNAKSVS